jgi:hypothetical protein
MTATDDYEVLDGLLCQLIAMGYDPVIARNALVATGGDMDAAVEVMLADEYETSMDGVRSAAAEDNNPVPTVTSSTRSASPPEIVEGTVVNSSESSGKQLKTTKEVLDTWGKQLLGDNHPAVRAHVKKGCMATKRAWLSAVDQVKAFDEEKKITMQYKQTMKKCDQQIKSLVAPAPEQRQDA